VTRAPAQGFASSQWLVSHEGQVTGGAPGKGAAQWEQYRGSAMDEPPMGTVTFCATSLPVKTGPERTDLIAPGSRATLQAMSEWVRTLVVGAGGFVGAVLRYSLGGMVSRAVSPEFPWGTLVVNVSGCFVIGLLAVLTEERGPVSPSTRLFLMVGVLGGYTTFSTFGYETLNLIREGSHGLAAANAVGQLLLGLAAVGAGIMVARGMA
jgi:CrcB protein